MTTDFKNFYEKWLRKADNYKKDSLTNHFDKFVTLFILYNFLYVEVLNQLVILGKQTGKPSEKTSEKTMATDYVVEFLGARYFIQCIEEMQGYWNELCSILEEKRFNIFFDLYGYPLQDEDNELLNNLRSKNSQGKALSILSVFYHVRCNLFHGRKEFEEIQKRLLIPINHLLRKTIEIVYNKLNQPTPK
jgi:hypothetical protein